MATTRLTVASIPAPIRTRLQSPGLALFASSETTTCRYSEPCGAPRAEPQSGQPFAHLPWPKLVSEFVIINGKQRRKHRAEDTAVKLVAVLHGIDTATPTAKIWRGGISTHFAGRLLAINLISRRMFSGLSAPGGIARMISGVVSKLSGLGDKFRRFITAQPAKVIDETSHRHPEDRSSHVANKRLKLGLADDGELRWLDDRELNSLISEYADFRDVFRFIWDFVKSHPSGDTMNQVLRPLLSTVVDNAADLARLQEGGEHDLRALFLLHIKNTFRLLDEVYNIGRIVQVKDQDRVVPPEMNHNRSIYPVETSIRVKNLMSASTLPIVCSNIINMAGNQKGMHISTSFMDRIVLDMEAILHDLPIPSYVISTDFYKRLRETYPPPVRTDWEPHLPVPGGFPDAEVPVQDSLEEIQPPPSFRPAGRAHKIAREGAKVLHWSISKQTPEQLESNLNVEADTFHAIRDAKSPLKTKEYMSEIRSALQSRKSHAPTSKRLHIGTPKAVRFAKSTLNPRSRTHAGVKVPRLVRHDGKSADQNSIAHQLRDGATAAQYLFSDLPETRIERDFRERAFENEAELMEFSRARSLHLRQTNVGPSKDGKMPYTSAEDIFSLPSQDLLRISDEKRTGIARLMEQEELKARLIAERAAHRKIEERLARTGGLRLPRQRFIAPLATEWMTRARDTLGATATATLATTGESVELKRHDFAKVVPPTEWLNDEIVNGSLNWLDKAINSAAGIKDPKKQTRKCLAMSSFFLKRLQEQGVTRTQRTLRRSGLEKNNISAVETILVPICERSHWTLLVIRPNKRTVAHMDSLNPRGSPAYTNLGMAWMKDVLEEKFQEKEWNVVRHDAPMQTNGYDCGVHTITNAMCVALGLNAVDSYRAEDMPLQRIRIACMLLNSGFTGEFDLRVY